MLSLTTVDNLLSLSLFFISSSVPSGQFFSSISKVLHECYWLYTRCPPKVPVLKGATHGNSSEFGALGRDLVMVHLSDRFCISFKEHLALASQFVIL